jgi:hypothetical protein
MWPVRSADNHITFRVPIVLKSGSYNLLQPSGPVQGLLYLLKSVLRTQAYQYIDYLQHIFQVFEIITLMEQEHLQK